jgi:alpha-ketoglutarate-dependent 2,4-dichlorophenoxyacetate dioxygenase
VSITIRKLHPLFACEVVGVKLDTALSPRTVTEIEAALDEYAVLVFRDQAITDSQQIAFSLHFGALEQPGATSNITRPEDRRLGYALGDLSNLDRNGRILARDDRQRMFNLGNRLWHSDSSYKVIPAKCSMLSARRLPSSGGETQFADMRAAYEALDAAERNEVEDLVCLHSLIYSRGLLGFDQELSDTELSNFEPVCQRLVRTLPSTGRRSLYLSAHAGGIVGWPVPEARGFLRELNERATCAQFVYSHCWQPHDLVIWDNRQTMHRLRPFNDLEEVRDMHRTTIAGDAPTVGQSG